MFGIMKTLILSSRGMWHGNNSKIGVVYHHTHTKIQGYNSFCDLCTNKLNQPNKIKRT